MITTAEKIEIYRRNLKKYAAVGNDELVGIQTRLIARLEAGLKVEKEK